MQNAILDSKTLVIKIGTSSLTRPDSGSLALGTIARLVETICKLQTLGHRVVLVSSGAIGVGSARLGITQRPKTIALKQAVAAVGQGRLMRIYDDLFSSLNQPIAQDSPCTEPKKCHYSHRSNGTNKIIFSTKMNLGGMGSWEDSSMI